MGRASSNDLVSVIMPAYNSEEFIAESIEAVLAQSYSNLELIIVVDGGHDGTGDLVASFRDLDPRVSVIYHDCNCGIAEARNSGLKLALGRYIAFCDSDDVWLSDKLSIQLEIMSDNNVALSHASVLIIDKDGNFLRNRTMPERVDLAMMKKRNFMINSSAVIDSMLFDTISQHDVKHEDYDMWLRLFKHDVVSLAVKRPLVKYRVHSDNVTSSALKSLGWMIVVQRKNNISWSSIFGGFFYNLGTRIFPFK